MKVNTQIIEKLNPCVNRFNNWRIHYNNFDGDALEFLNLDKITAKDKIWVILRLLRDENDLFTIQTFAIDCAFAGAAAPAAFAADYAADAAASDDADAAAGAAAYAAYAAVAIAAAYAVADSAEQERQIDCLAYLLEGR